MGLNSDITMLTVKAAITTWIYVFYNLCVLYLYIMKQQIDEMVEYSLFIHRLTQCAIQY